MSDQPETRNEERKSLIAELRELGNAATQIAITATTTDGSRLASVMADLAEILELLLEDADV